MVMKVSFLGVSSSAEHFVYFKKENRNVIPGENCIYHLMLHIRELCRYQTADS